MATYTKDLSETRNVFVKEDGELIMKQELKETEDGLQCCTMPTTDIGSTSSSEAEYEDVGDEILEFGRVGQRPTHAP